MIHLDGDDTTTTVEAPVEAVEATEEETTTDAAAEVETPAETV